MAPRGKSPITQRARRRDIDEGNGGAGLLFCEALQSVKLSVGQVVHWTNLRRFLDRLHAAAGFRRVQSWEEATFRADLLNGPIAQVFYGSMVFWEDKRPITVGLLKTPIA